MLRCAAVVPSAKVNGLLLRSRCASLQRHQCNTLVAPLAGARGDAGAIIVADAGGADGSPVSSEDEPSPALEPPHKRPAEAM